MCVTFSETRQDTAAAIVSWLTNEQWETSHQEIRESSEDAQLKYCDASCIIHIYCVGMIIQLIVCVRFSVIIIRRKEASEIKWKGKRERERGTNEWKKERKRKRMSIHWHTMTTTCTQSVIMWSGTNVDKKKSLCVWEVPLLFTHHLSFSFVCASHSVRTNFYLPSLSLQLALSTCIIIIINNNIITAFEIILLVTFHSKDFVGQRIKGKV